MDHPITLPGLPNAGVPDSAFFVGNATLVLRIGGMTLLTDPNFLHAGDHAHIGYGMTTRRLHDPAIELEDVPPLDAVLLSHYHGDHFDQIVRDRLRRTLPIVTTPHAAARLRRYGFSATLPLRTWERALLRKGDAEVRITAVPGKHGPGPLAAALPPVMGSIIEFPRAGGGTMRMYVSGDTLVFDGLREIPKRFPGIDIAFVHLGGTRVFGILVTLDGNGGIEALRIIDPRVAIPVHYEEYDVFTSPLADFLQAAERAGWRDRVHVVRKGETYEV